MRISLVVAAARNGTIGLRGEIPWKLPDDQRFFPAIGKFLAVRTGHRVFARAQFAEEVEHGVRIVALLPGTEPVSPPLRELIEPFAVLREADLQLDLFARSHPALEACRTL